jgi:hypothetical protein
MKGWASLPVAQVEDARCPGDTGITLRVEPETSRHQLHADIVGWPQSEEDRLYLATLLAEASVLKLHA